MSKIKYAFNNGKALIAFFTCGDPDLETTAAAIREAVKNGVDLVDLGIPFSDPTAEGPVLQEASYRALAGGITTDKIFDFVKKLRKDITVPMVFSTYANVVFSYGTERFISTCRKIGIDGLVIPDIPFEEKNEFSDVCKENEVDLISFVASSSDDRIAMISKEAGGFLYVFANAATEATFNEFETDLARIVKEVRANADVPCVVGIEISSEKHIKAVSQIVDGVVVETDLVEILAQYGRNAPQYVGEYVKKVRELVC